jgi:hypothetical protein
VSENKEASAEEKKPESKKRINITNISELNSKSPSAYNCFIMDTNLPD